MVCVRVLAEGVVLVLVFVGLCGRWHGVRGAGGSDSFVFLLGSREENVEE